LVDVIVAVGLNDAETDERRAGIDQIVALTRAVSEA